MISATFLSDCSKLFRTELKRPYAQKIRYNSNILWMLSIPSHNWGWVEQWHILRMASDSSQTLLKSGTSGNSRSRPSPNYGNGFFIPFLFPNRGNGFFHSLPVPELWEWIFSFPSRSQIVGMDFFNSRPIPEFAISFGLHISLNL